MMPPPPPYPPPPMPSGYGPAAAAAIQPAPSVASATAPPGQEAAVSQLTAMGFSRGAAIDALRRANFDVTAATNLLLG